MRGIFATPNNNTMHLLNSNTVKIILLSSLFTGATFAARSQNCTQTATGSNINVTSGQVICVTSDMSANVDIASGGTLKVQPGATLTIQNFNNFNGTLINNGTVIAGNINYGTGGSFVNNNQVTINGNQNYNGTATVTNAQAGTFTVNGTFSLVNASTINNDGTYISTNGDVSFNSGTINNNGRFEVRGGNFNPNGTLTNNGFFKVNNFINFNGGTVYNNCRFVVGNGFNVNNNTNFVNDGLVWVTNTTSGKIQHNSGIWMNTKRGLVRGHDFINSAVVSGSGDFYFTGDTRQQGTFAGTSSNADSAIRFYDNSYSPNVTGSAFDFGIQGANVVRATIIPGDTITLGSICNQQTFIPITPVPLSLDLLQFNAVAANGDVLLNWETSNEANVREFIVEYSKDGASWNSVGSVAAGGSVTFNSYQFTHFGVNAALNLYRLKMMDIDGKFTYSPIKSVTIKDLSGSELRAYPNPVNDMLNLEFENHDKLDFVKIFVTDMAGKILMISDWKLNEGINDSTINIKKLPQGIYFLALRNNIDGAVMLQKKIIKN
jgi:hypothetical protein